MSLSILVYLLIFLSVLLLVGGAYLAWQSARGPGAGRVARRLRAMNTATDDREKTISITKDRPLSLNPTLQVLLEAVPGVKALDRLLLQSGKSWNVGKFLGFSLLGFVASSLLLSVFSIPLYMRLGLMFLCTAIPYFLVARTKAARLEKIEQQLPDALDLMGRSMRAGHAFPTALKLVGEEMSDPLADEFRTVFDEVNFGVSMSDALMNLAARVPSTDLRYFVIAVLIQRETGGNLTELLGSISAIIRDRLKLLGQVRVLSAEGRMSAWVLGLLPFGSAALMNIVNPEFMSVLYTDPAGQKMVGIALSLLVVGIFFIRKVIRIRV